MITHLASLADIVWRMVESYGRDPLPLFQDHRIDPNTANDPNRRIAKHAFLELWKAAEEPPSGGVRDDTVARVLYMSPRTLQRKLKQKGTSFRQLVRQTRRELAEQYLAEGKYTATEISFMLGFSEISAFSRAYKKWTGVSPGAEVVAN